MVGNSSGGKAAGGSPAGGANTGGEGPGSMGGGGGAGGEGGATCRRSEFQESELAKLNMLSPLAAPPADLQTVNPALTVVNPLGNTGAAGKVVCASCHTGPSMDDRGSPLEIISLGTGAGTRNAPGS